MSDSMEEELQKRLSALPEFLQIKFKAATGGEDTFKYKVDGYDYASPEVQIDVFEGAKSIAEALQTPEAIRAWWQGFSDTSVSLEENMKAVPNFPWGKMSAMNVGMAIKVAIEYSEKGK